MQIERDIPTAKETPVRRKSVELFKESNLTHFYIVSAVNHEHLLDICWMGEEESVR